MVNHDEIAYRDKVENFIDNMKYLKNRDTYSELCAIIWEVYNKSQDYLHSDMTYSVTEALNNKKDTVLKIILESLVNLSEDSLDIHPYNLCEYLKNMGVKWPELDIIQQSVPI